MKESVARVVTALVGAALVILVTVQGGVLFVALVAVVALLGQNELYRLMRQAGHRPYSLTGLLLGLLFVARPYVSFWLEAAVAVGIVLLVQVVFSKSDDAPLANTGATILGVVYPTTLLSFLVEVRLGSGLPFDNRTALAVTLLVLFLVWASDIFALYVGSSIGKHPFFPRVSPKKTWEGYFGGLAGAVVVAVLFVFLAEDILAWYDVAILLVLCGVIAPIGDLIESRFKRSVHAKDSGGLLPGHGGILDRIDTIILGGSLSWVYLVLRFTL